MQILEIPYATWSTLVDANSLLVFDIHKTAATRFAFAGSRASGIVWKTFAGGADYTDYASKYETGSVQVVSDADAVAHIIGLELGALPTIQEVRPNLYPDGITLTFAGRGDDPTNGRMLGDRFNLSNNLTNDDETLTFGFNDQITLSGGMVDVKDAQLGDWVRYDIEAPATPTPPTSGGTLNCVRVEVIPSSGLYMLVPATEGATHFLDLADPTKWVPVPAQRASIGTQRRVPDGFWEWNYPTTGKGALAARPSQDGWWNLYEFSQAPLARFAPDVNLLGSGKLDLGVGESLRPQVLLPHWNHKVTLHNEAGSHDVQIVWNLLVGRYKPQPGNG